MVSKPEKKLKLVHLQLTSRCNLQCRFCGQWGEHGFENRSHHCVDLAFDDWKRAIDSIVAYCRESLPHICIWGGEPLMANEFVPVLEYLHQTGFNIGVVTNGTLLDRYVDEVNRYVKTLYISLDGVGDIHDQSRGTPGVYSKITRNLAMLKRADIQLICLFTINQTNYRHIVDFPLQVESLGLKKIIYQNLIFCTSKDAETYSKWLKEKFDLEAKNVGSWITDEFDSYLNELPELTAQVKENIKQGRYQQEVLFHPAEIDKETILDWYYKDDSLLPYSDVDYCRAPLQHIQIAANGNVHCCVDFNDHYVGNIKRDDLIDCYLHKMQLYQQEIEQGRNPLCKRCPWRYNDSYKLD